MDEKQCLECNGPLRFVAHYGAPGIGQSWECQHCGTAHSVVGGSVHLAEDMAHVREPEFFA